MWALQIWLVAFLFFAYVLLLQVIELFGFAKGWTTAGISVVAAFLWFVLVGRNIGEIQENARRFFVLRFSVNMLVSSCIGVTLVVAILASALVYTQTVVITPEFDGVMKVYLVDGSDPPSLQGEASKQAPFKGRFRTGKRTFLFTANDFEEKKQPLDLKGGLFSDEQHLPIELISIPRFEASSIEVLEAQENTASYPEKLRLSPSKTIRFTVTCPSPTPFQITEVGIQVAAVPSKEGWSFPDFGEAPGVGAGVVKGYAEFTTKSRFVPFRGIDVPVVGKKQGSATYEIAIFGEPGFSYNGDALDLQWVDVNQQIPKNTKIKIPAPRFSVTFQRDWATLLPKELKPLRVIYNCRIDKLAAALARLDAKLQFQILVIDPDAPKFFRDEGIRLPKNIRYVAADQPHAFGKLLETPDWNPQRPCSALVIDERRMLLQDSKSAKNGLLVQDPQKTVSVLREFDRVFENTKP